MSDEFYAVVWCPDCNGFDFEGCFEGGADRLGPFATREEAEQAGENATWETIWKYEIESGEDG